MDDNVQEIEVGPYEHVVQVCPQCNGTGAYDGVNCPRCHGMLYVPHGDCDA